jgi:hypothetical protein
MAISSVSRTQYAQNRLRFLGAEDDGCDGFLAHQRYPRKPVFKFDRTPIGQFVDILSLGFDAGLSQGLGRGETVNGPGIDEKLGFEALAAPGEPADGGCYMRQTHCCILLL